METETPREFDVELNFPTAQWQFWGIAREQLIKVDWYGRFAETRILQRYLEACDYKLLFFLDAWMVTKHRQRWLQSQIAEAIKDIPGTTITREVRPVVRGKRGIPKTPPPEPPAPETPATAGRTYEITFSEVPTRIDGCHHSNRNIIESRLGFTYPDPKDLRFSSMCVIDIRALCDDAAHRFKDLGKKTTELIPIRDASKVWYDLGENMKANVQAWMRKTKRKDGQESGPIFSPVERAEASDPRGSRLDFADVVTVGLVHWLLRHGTRYSDFEGTPKVTILG